MIIVKLEGGIGNQLFQYATGRHLSLINQTQLGFDISSFESDSQRSFLLDRLRIKGRVADEEEIESLVMRPPSLPERIVRKAFHLPPRSTRTHIKEKNRSFDPKVLESGDGVYLEGYWQSEKYFAEISDVIRGDLELKDNLPEKAQAIADQIRKSESVSLHIRRGDYVSDTVVNKKHGTCSMHYYRESVRAIAENLSDPCFFLFSDGLEWVKKNLHLDNPGVIVDCGGDDNPEVDLKLMSLCRHNIIANSSFSWWGAWLNPNPDKIVMAPSRWMNIKRDTRDLFPDGWIVNRTN